MSVSGTNEATQSVPFGTPAATGAANAAGSAGTAARSDHVHLASGTLVYTTSTSNTTTSGTTEATVITAGSATVVSGRRIKVTYNVPDITETVAGDAFTWRIKEDGVTAATKTVRVPTGGGVGGQTWFAVLTPSAGAHVYTVTVQRASGTGTQTHVHNGSSAPGWVLVEDIGVQ